MNSARPALIMGVLLIILMGPAEVLCQLQFESSPIHMPVTVSDRNPSDDFGGPADNTKKTEPKKAVAQPESHLSKTKAMLLSLVLPGAGQYYAGAKGRAEVFFGWELVTWAGVYAFHTYGGWKKDDYIRYAQLHASIDPAGKDDNFYKNLTFYENREDYNSAGRIIEPTAPYYPPDQSYYWQWDGQSSQDTFHSMRNASKSAFRKATFMIGVAVFNRIVSSIDALRTVKNIAGQGHEEAPGYSQADNKVKFKFNCHPFGSNPRIGIGVSRNF
ncbi:hypothetical protein TRIP_C60262 [Candidatus Zixiibacteriota bacterium]|nr:hypothetical protein TRIP_C60262 [candidate division Zixibacteria bacterium]